MKRIIQHPAAMKFAGLLLEGGIIGYDSNIETGGNGAMYRCWNSS